MANDPEVVGGEPLTAVTTDLGPAVCPICGSVGTGRHMHEHLEREHPAEIDNLVFAVCIGGVEVTDGQYTDSADAVARAMSVKHTLRKLDGRNHEPVQILVWPQED